VEFASALAAPGSGRELHVSLCDSVCSPVFSTWSDTALATVASMGCSWGRIIGGPDGFSLTRLTGCTDLNLSGDCGLRDDGTPRVALPTPRLQRLELESPCRHDFEAPARQPAWPPSLQSVHCSLMLMLVCGHEVVSPLRRGGCCSSAGVAQGAAAGACAQNGARQRGSAAGGDAPGARPGPRNNTPGARPGPRNNTPGARPGPRNNSAGARHLC
jgi:hypothetical protein